MKSARGQREVGDNRVFNNSDYFLDNAFVDSFEHEVRRPARMHSKDELGGETIAEDEGYVAEAGDPQLDSCASNWKAAASTEKKRMWGTFDETGVFASACPHGFILWLTDMVQSGELCVRCSAHSHLIAN